MLLYLKRIDPGNVFLWLWHRKEAFIWIAALLALAFTHPAEHHHTLCPFHNLGWSFCPGCGIGRSISYFFHLEIQQSLFSHPLGIPAVLIIAHRIYQIMIKPMTIKNKM